MRMILYAGLACAMLFTVSRVSAYPTLTGPTGQAVIPTAEVASSGLTVAGDWVDLETGNSFPLRALIPLGMGVEVGALYDPFNNEVALDNAMSANAKIRIGRFVGGDAAIGGLIRRDKDVAGFHTDSTQGYFAWTTGFAPSGGTSNLNLTLGGNWTRIDPDTGPAVDAMRGFAGVRVNLIKDLTLMAEYQTKSSDLGDIDPITAYTVRLGKDTGVQLEAGMTNAFGLIGTGDQNPFAGISITFATSGGRY